MPLDGITAKCLSYELNEDLAGARLDRIYQPDRHDIILHFRADNRNLRLILSANPAAPRIHLTSETRDNPSEPPMFCMLLRKHLIGARLLKLETPGYERIFQLTFQTTNELGDILEKQLIIEIMGRHSNIILINQDGRIHDAILHVDQSMSRIREVMPARPYALPPAQDKLSPDEALARIEQNRSWITPAVDNKPIGKVLLENLQGFSPQLCHDLVYQAGLDERMHLSQISPLQLQQLDTALKHTFLKIRDRNFSPTVYYIQEKDPVPVDFHALDLQDSVWKKSVASVSEAMDLFYVERRRQNALKQKKQHLEKLVNNQLEHVRKKLAFHDADLAEGNKRETYRKYGELILSNIHAAAAGQEQLTVLDYYEPDQPELTIPLQGNLSPSQNAQRWFKQYAKARTKFETGARLARQDHQDIAWLSSLISALAAAADMDDLSALRQEIAAAGLIAPEKGKPDDVKREAALNRMNPGKPGKSGKSGKKNAKNYQQAKNKKSTDKGTKQPAALPPRRYISPDGFEILVGRNNIQNDQLTLKTAQKDDLWLHVQRMPGTHVIVRCQKQTVPAGTLQRAAETAAWFSRAGGENNSGVKMAVDYCPVSHVRKPAGARPGMVIYEHYQTIIVSPLDPADMVAPARIPDEE